MLQQRDLQKYLVAAKSSVYKGTHEATTREKFLTEKEQIVPLKKFYSLSTCPVQCPKKAALRAMQPAVGCPLRLRNEMYCNRTWTGVSVDKFMGILNRYLY